MIKVTLDMCNGIHSYTENHNRFVLWYPDLGLSFI